MRRDGSIFDDPSPARGFEAVLGIDAGGTFTDFAYMRRGAVASSLKIPTMHDDILFTIKNGISLLMEKTDLREAGAVHLASTLATNATVEGKISPAGLLLIGYAASDAASALSAGALGTGIVELTPGGHDGHGDEKEPFDETLAASAVRSLLARGARGLAVSAFFSVRNPAHELRALELIRRNHPGVSVTCGHELASELNAFKRAATAAVNAGLIPIVTELLEAVKVALRSFGIFAPLSVVKGDGALVSSEWAGLHPVETVVSGPAASAIGACFLTGIKKNRRRSWIVDIGGTTTDIIGLDDDGNPVVNAEGADIGGRRLLVSTIDIRTFGLGGDSRVSRLRDGSLAVGPGRVIPNSVAAYRDPRVIDLLKEIDGSGSVSKEPVAVFSGRPGIPETEAEERILGKLRGGPSTFDRLAKGESKGIAPMTEKIVSAMETRGLVQLSSFTPTDALIASGALDKWSGEAALLGAAIFARLESRPTTIENLCGEIRSFVSGKLAGEIFRKSLVVHGIPEQIAASGAIDLGLRREIGESSPAVSLRLNGDVIGAGAPAWAFLGEAAEMLGEKASLPENAPIAGAVGAAIGAFFMSHTLLITPAAEIGGFRVHLPSGVMDFADLGDAVSESARFMVPWLTARSLEAGAISPRISWSRADETAMTNGSMGQVYLWTRMTFKVTEKRR
ncbi:MAG: hydantoinase/oxoprolinase family protein [Synergistaceae bacterium]|jgi:hypothetical protein|nr:hydantoinase/oxoprolinase family protein [Synergistaceae bacterium]